MENHSQPYTVTPAKVVAGLIFTFFTIKNIVVMSIVHS